MAHPQTAFFSKFKMLPPNPDEPEPKRSHAKTQRRQDLIYPLPLRALRLGVRFFYQKCKNLTSKILIEKNAQLGVISYLLIAIRID